MSSTVICYINVLLTFYSKKSCNDITLSIKNYVRERIMLFNDRSPVSALFSFVSLTSTLSVMRRNFFLKNTQDIFLHVKVISITENYTLDVINPHQ